MTTEHRRARRRPPLLNAAAAVARSLCAAALLATSALAETPVPAQIADPEANLSVATPRWARGQGPRVAVDAGHRNFHTLTGRFAPFAEVLRNEGYRVAGLDEAVTAERLGDVDVLVIANALGEPVGELETLTGSAFTPAEIETLRVWVADGGSLLLIADHPPFPSAIWLLAAAFGVHWDNAIAARPDGDGPDLFTADGGLSSSPILQGEGRRVRQVRTFTGSAFRAPPGAEPLLRLGDGWAVFLPDQNQDISPRGARLPADGRLQAAALRFGKGRAIFAGEAAMFTAQRAGPEQRANGMGAPGAEDNKAAILNMLAWLSQPLAQRPSTEE